MKRLRRNTERERKRAHSSKVDRPISVVYIHEEEYDSRLKIALDVLDSRNK